MTCIIGVECSDGAVLAGDFLGSNGFTKQLVTQSKIFEHSGIMYGYTSTFRFGQLLEFCLDDNSLYPPSKIEDTYPWLVRNLVPKLKEIMKENECKGGNAILVLNRQVWELQDDFSVLRSPDGIVSVGSGCYHAVASMKTMLKLHGKQPTTVKAIQMLETAYDVISETNCGVSRQFNYIVG